MADVEVRDQVGVLDPLVGPIVCHLRCSINFVILPPIPYRKCTFSLFVAPFNASLKMGPGARFQGFWDPLAHFDVQEARNFWFGWSVTEQQVLPRVVCLCGAVGVCGECHRVGHVEISFHHRGHF